MWWPTHNDAIGAIITLLDPEADIIDIVFRLEDIEAFEGRGNDALDTLCRLLRNRAEEINAR